MTTTWYSASASGLPWWKNVAVAIDVNTPPATENLWVSMGDIEDAKTEIALRRFAEL
jgi:hypothetical protein